MGIGKEVPKHPVNDQASILVIDDDLATQQALRIILSQQGHHVEAVGSGAEALARIAQRAAEGSPYALLLIDLHLGDLSGIEILRYAQKLDAGIQSVILTGHADVGSAIAALREGARDYLLKPYQLDQLQLVVARTLALRQGLMHQNQLLAQARGQAQELATLNIVGQKVSQSLDLEEVLGLIMEQLRVALRAEAGFVALLEENQRFFQAAPDPTAEQVKAFALPLERGISGCCAQENRPFRGPEAQGDEQHWRALDAQTGFTTRDVLCVPLVAEGQVIGAIQALNRLDGCPFDAHDLKLLEAISIPASVAVVNARLHRNLEVQASALKQALEEIEELDQLKTQFVQSISHELRTPLTFIKGYIELLLAGTIGPVSQAQQESLNVVAHHAESLTQLVNDIILVQEGTLQGELVGEVLLQEVIRNAVGCLRAKAEQAGVAIEQQLPNQHSVVLGNQANLNRVMIGLLDNAIKFSPNGGTVTIRLLEADESWEVRVEDTGIGIPEEKLGRIFERFYQVDGSTTRRFRGTGLGLAIAQQVVRSHAGEIWVNSQEGVGSTFCFRLPQAHSGIRYHHPSEKGHDHKDGASK